MNITRKDIFEAGYMTYLAVYEHFDGVARELDRLYLRPDLPADKKDAIFQPVSYTHLTLPTICSV